MKLSSATALAAALLCVSGLVGCGSDDGPDASPSDTSGQRQSEDSATSDAPDEPGAPVVSDLDIEGAQEALDAVGDDALADALGRSLSSVLQGAVDYRLEDGRLVVEMEGDNPPGSSACLIATTARDGIGGSTPISLDYADGRVDCD